MEIWNIYDIDPNWDMCRLLKSRVETKRPTRRCSPLKSEARSPGRPRSSKSPHYKGPLPGLRAPPRPNFDGENEAKHVENHWKIWGNDRTCCFFSWCFSRCCCCLFNKNICGTKWSEKEMENTSRNYNEKECTLKMDFEGAVGDLDGFCGWDQQLWTMPCDQQQIVFQLKQ